MIINLMYIYHLQILSQLHINHTKKEKMFSLKCCTSYFCLVLWKLTGAEKTLQSLHLWEASGSFFFFFLHMALWDK